MEEYMRYVQNMSHCKIKELEKKYGEMGSIDNKVIWMMGIYKKIHRYTE